MSTSINYVSASVNPETKAFQVQRVPKDWAEAEIILGFDTEHEAIEAAKAIRKGVSCQDTEYLVLENIMLTKNLGRW